MLQLLCLTCLADPLDNWQVRSPLPFSADLLDVAYGDGRFVAVGVGGYVGISTNGIWWEAHDSHLGTSIYDVAAGGGRIVAAAVSGQATTSTDGVNWVAAPPPVPIEGLGYANGEFLGGGYDWNTSIFRIIASTDGTNWTQRATIPGNVTQVYFGGGRYLATGYGGDIYVSTNTTDWTTSNTGTFETHEAVCYANGLYVVVGDYNGARVSTDAVNWVQTGVGVAGPMRDVFYYNGQFVAVGRQELSMVSTDGTNWTKQVLPNAGAIIDYNGAAVGPSNVVAVGSRSEVATSTDATNWTERFQGSVEDLFAIAYTSNQWMAVGALQDTIGSADGIHWGHIRSQVRGAFYDIVYTNGWYVVANYYPEYDIGSVFVSTNLANGWTQYSPSGAYGMYGVAFGNGRWVAVGDPGVIWEWESLDQWNLPPSVTSAMLTSVTFGNGQFVAVGDQGTILTSPDGLEWTVRNVGTTEHLNGVVWAAGQYVCVGTDGTILTSTDAITWTPRVSGTLEILTDVRYGEGTFVAVGTAGTILTSRDGLQWSARDSRTTSDLFGVGYGDHSFIAVGTTGTAVQCDPYIQMTMKSDRTVDVTGPLQRSVSIETNSVVSGGGWGPATTLVLTNSAGTWLDSSPDTRRFYRAKLLPQVDKL